MMKLALLLVVVGFAACSFAQGYPGQFVPSFNNHGNFDVIWANNTSFLDEIDGGGVLFGGKIYVAAEGFIREIVEEPFEISYREEFKQWHSFIDFKAFTRYNHTMVVGPISPLYVPGDYGINHPFQIADAFDHDVSSHTMLSQLSSVAVTNMSDHVVMYAAGWGFWPTHDGDKLMLNFTVGRIFVHPGMIPFHNGSFLSGNPYQVNNETDFVQLPHRGYIEYTRGFKPWVFHCPMRQIVIVIDPATGSIYTFNAGNNPNVSFAETASGSMRLLTNPYSAFVSAVYDYDLGYAYIGIHGDGVLPGGLLCINVTQNPITLIFNKTFHDFEGYPSALDIRNNSLFIGYYGLGLIVQMDKWNGTVQKFATLPFYLSQVSGIHAGVEHIYFVTYEQTSKVARTLYQHFCETPCDFFYGYCNNGSCACVSSHKLVDGNRCELNSTVPVNKDAEIALGIFFALTLIAAFAGWVVVWRMRRGSSYTAIRE